MWSAIVTAGKAILGTASSGNVDRVIDVAKGVGGWIDEQQWTDEEKAKYTAEVAARVGDFVAATASENTARSLTRRSIAIWIMRFELLILAASGLLFRFDAGWAEYLYRLASYDSPLGAMALGVAVFFFGSHMLRTR